MIKNSAVGLSILIMISSTACSVTSNAAPSAREQQKTVADPSVKKCIADGYRSVPVTKDGVVLRYLCIDPVSHKKCDSWHYFRGECTLKD